MYMDLSWSKEPSAATRVYSAMVPGDANTLHGSACTALTKGYPGEIAVHLAAGLDRVQHDAAKSVLRFLRHRLDITGLRNFLH